jgi:stage II sporulation protein D
VICPVTVRLSHFTICLVFTILCAGGCIPSRFHDVGVFDDDRIPPPAVRVRLITTGSRFTLRGDGRFIVRTASPGKQSDTFSTPGPVTLSFSHNRIKVRGEKNAKLADDLTGVWIAVTDSTQRLWLGDVPYFGVLLFGFGNDGNPLVTNRLNLDAYLTGVLAPEMGERSPDEIEAVKAQAVAARTYALAHLGQYENTPFDLKADISDQVYVGASQQRTWVDQAVAATAGEVITYGSHLIDAYYHSTCGGRTDNIEDVWPKPPRPFLVSVDDDTFCHWSKYSIWTETFDKKTLLKNLRAYRKQFNPPPIKDFKTIKDIRLEGETPGGRVKTMTVVTPQGEWTVGADQIRWALGRPSRPGSILPSDRFKLDLKRDRHKNVIGAVVSGAGYGHGVGMCQCGMIGRARTGQLYRDILTHYYTGVQIVRVY